MFQWFLAGGVPMIPVLLVGGMALVASMRHAAGPSRGWARASATLRGCALVLGLGGVAMDLSAVGGGVGTLAAEAAASGSGDAQIQAIAMIGFGEAMGPLVLAALFVAIGALFAAAGDVRDTNPLPAR